jgi:tetratricopeptide (TPR) repeat protein
MGNKGIFLFSFIAFFSLLVYSASQAQVEEYELGQQLRYLDLGKRQFENGNYANADESFRTVLDAVKVLPAEICYYFGANSYYLGKYKQSINWLNKYIELKGTSGQFFEESTNLLEQARNQYRQMEEAESGTNYEPSQQVDYTVMPEVDCGPTGKVVCPVCKGQTVIIKRSALSVDYRSCPYCDDHGNLSCDNYNLLLQGKLKPKDERLEN